MTFSITDVVQSVAGAVLLAVLGGGRYMIRVPISKLMIDPTVSGAVRKDTPDPELLQNSIARLGGEPINPISVQGQTRDGKFVVGDGEQRLKALIKLKAESCVVQLVEAWRTAEDAIAATLQLNSARYNLTHADLLNALAKSTMSVQTFSDYTGLSKSTVERLKLISDKSWMVEAVLKEYVGYVPAGDLIRACVNDAAKLSALQNSFTKVYQEDTDKATQWQQRFKRETGKKWKSEVRPYATLPYWGRKRDWSDWKMLLDSGAIETIDGKLALMLPTDVASQQGLRGIHIEDSNEEWSKRFAVSNLEGAKWSELATEDLAQLDEKMEKISQWVHTAYMRRMESSSSSADLGPQAGGE